MTSARAVKKSGTSRLRRYLWRALLGVVVLTIVPVVCLRWIPPPTSAFMLERRVAGYFRGDHQREVRYRWVSWQSISPQMRLAVVAGEDQKFPHHWGFDFDSIADAVEHQGAKGRLRGASTITQQVAKNLFLWPGRSFVRKGLEAYLTVAIECIWPKRRILEVYLNVAEFGRGIYGVGAASDAFFKQPPAELSREEAALLAAVLPNPRRLRVEDPSPYVRRRADWIRGQMEQLGGTDYLRGM